MNGSYCVLTDEDREIIRALKMVPPSERGQTEALCDRLANKEGLVRALCCENCGSENVVCEGHTKWNAEKQQFELAEVSDTYQAVYCRDCHTGEQSGKWVWRERRKPLFGCAYCGCTDIEYESWVEVNTGNVTDDCNSRNRWCPQCQDSETRSDEVDRLQPYDKDRTIVER